MFVNRIVHLASSMRQTCLVVQPVGFGSQYQPARTESGLKRYQARLADKKASLAKLLAEDAKYNAAAQPQDAAAQSQDAAAQAKAAQDRKLHKARYTSLQREIARLEELVKADIQPSVYAAKKSGPIAVNTNIQATPNGVFKQDVTQEIENLVQPGTSPFEFAIRQANEAHFLILNQCLEARQRLYPVLQQPLRLEVLAPFVREAEAQKIGIPSEPVYQLHPLVVLALLLQNTPPVFFKKPQYFRTQLNLAAFDPFPHLRGALASHPNPAPLNDYLATCQSLIAQHKKDPKALAAYLALDILLTHIKERWDKIVISSTGGTQKRKKKYVYIGKVQSNGPRRRR